MGEPLHERAAIPPTVLHGVANPAQIFYSNDGIAPHMREVSYLLCGKDRQLPLFARCRFTVELRLVEGRHPALTVAKKLARLPPELSNLPFRRADTIP